MTWLAGVGLSAGRWLLFTPTGRKVLLALVVAGVALYYRHQLIDAGKNLGRTEQREQQQETIKEGLGADRNATTVRDQQINARLAAAESKAASAEARSKQLYAEARAAKQAEPPTATVEQKLTVCEGVAAKMEGAYDARGEQLDQLMAANRELMAKYENKAAYTVRLEGRFVELWNSNPPKRKCWHKFWCGKDRLKPPPLDAIRAEVTPTK